MRGDSFGLSDAVAVELGCGALPDGVNAPVKE